MNDYFNNIGFKVNLSLLIFLQHVRLQTSSRARPGGLKPDRKRKRIMSKQGRTKRIMHEEDPIEEQLSDRSEEM